MIGMMKDFERVFKIDRPRTGCQFPCDHGAKRAAKRVVRKKARSGRPARVEPDKAKPADGATPNTDGVITQLVKVVPAPVGKPLEARPTKRTKTKRVERRWVPEPVRVNHYHGGFSY